VPLIDEKFLRVPCPRLYRGQGFSLGGRDYQTRIEAAPNWRKTDPKLNRMPG
jgi:hypothetical protein